VVSACAVRFGIPTVKDQIAIGHIPFVGQRYAVIGAYGYIGGSRARSAVGVELYRVCGNVRGSGRFVVVKLAQQGVHLPALASVGSVVCAEDKEKHGYYGKAERV
jgi:hypothetical protein